MKFFAVTLGFLVSSQLLSFSVQATQVTCLGSINGKNERIIQLETFTNGTKNSVQLNYFLFKTPGTFPCSVNQDGTPESVECHSNILLPNDQRVAFSILSEDGILNIGRVTHGNGETLELTCLSQ